MQDSSDGLEITAIGTLYKGPWEKKYWSSSRGKDRYPYPIGYQANRNHVGHIYKMEIQEGSKGPKFVVISEDGISCHGETPTIAWENVQKKKNMRSQKRLRNQFTRVAGSELFGFTNPLVQRLFRELVANENGTPKQSAMDIHHHGRALELGAGVCFSALSDSLPSADACSMSNITNPGLKQQLKADKGYIDGIRCTDESKFGIDKKMGRLLGCNECTAEGNLSHDVIAKSDYSVKGKKICSSQNEANKDNVLNDKNSCLLSVNDATDSAITAPNHMHSNNYITYSRRGKLNGVSRQKSNRSMRASVECEIGTTESHIVVPLAQYNLRSSKEAHTDLNLFFSYSSVAETTKAHKIETISEDSEKACSILLRNTDNMITPKHQGELIVSGETTTNFITPSEFLEKIQYPQPPPVTTEGSIRKKRLKLVKQKAAGTLCLEISEDNDGSHPEIEIHDSDIITQSPRDVHATGEIGLIVPDTLDVQEHKRPLNSLHVLKDTNKISTGIITNKEDTVFASLLSDKPRCQGEMGSTIVEHEKTLEPCPKLEVNAANQHAGVNLVTGILDGCDLELNWTQPSKAHDEVQADCIPASLSDIKVVLEETKADDEQMNTAIPLEDNPNISLKEPMLLKECALSPSQQFVQYSATQSSDGTFDKGDSDSIGQELAKSMMKVLLPQVLPLLKQEAKEKSNNKVDQHKHTSSLTKYDLNLVSLDEHLPVRYKTETLPCEMLINSNVKTPGDEVIDSGLSFGGVITDCRQCTESMFSCAKTSTEENIHVNSCTQGAEKKITLSNAANSYAGMELENSVSIICRNDCAEVPFLANQCPNKDISPMLVINVLEVSKPSDSDAGEDGIKQKIYKSAFCETMEKVTETHDEDFFKVSSGTNEKQAQCSMHPSCDQNEKLKKYSSKLAQEVTKSLEENNKIAFSKQYGMYDDLGNTLDPAVLECVVPDSFEDVPCRNQNAQRTQPNIGELRAYYENHNPSIDNTEADPGSLGTFPMTLEDDDAQKFDCIPINKDINLRRKSCLFYSAEYDVKDNPIMVNPFHGEAVEGMDIQVSDSYINRVSPQDRSLSEVNPGKNGNHECNSVFDNGPHKGGLLDRMQHSSTSHREQKGTCELTAKDINFLHFEENVPDEKSHNVSSACGTGQSSDLQDRFHSRSPQSWNLGITGKVNPQKKQNEKVTDLSHNLHVTSDEVDMSAPSFPFADKELPHVVSTLAGDNLDVSQLIFKEWSDFKHPKKIPDIASRASQIIQTKTDKLSGIQHTVFPSVSNLELHSRVTMDVVNHQSVDSNTNVNSYEDVRVASCYQNIQTESLSKVSKGIQSVFTFSDVPPSTLMSKTAPNISCSEFIRSSHDANINTHHSTNANMESIQSIELVGCYEHPITVISMALSVQGEEIHLCVVCGLPQGRERSLFIYKVLVGEVLDYSSNLVGYVETILPNLEDYFDIHTKSTLDRYGIQLTPDGQNLILLQSIKIQDLREPGTNCVRSQCVLRGQCQGHGVKLVSAKDGQVSVSTRLSSTESMYCILVSAPQSIIAAGENGSIHVWNMNLSWSTCLEEFRLPSAGPSLICELLAVPGLSHLIIGRDHNGCYIFWDVCRRILLSKFQNVGYNIFQSIVLGIVSWNDHGNIKGSFIDQLPNEISNTKDLKGNVVSKEQGEPWTKGNNFPCLHLDFSKENIAICLLVLAAPYNDDIQRNQDRYSDELKLRGLWRLAVLENNVLLVGSTLDARASAACIISQTGVIGTSEGYIYAWEVMTGRKVFISSDFEGLSISCLSANAASHAFAVAGSDHRVLLYMQTSASSSSCLMGNK